MTELKTLKILKRFTLNNLEAWDIDKKGFFITRDSSTIFINWNDFKDLKRLIKGIEEVFGKELVE